MNLSERSYGSLYQYMMQLTAIAAMWGLTACIKLEERNIKLVTDCEKCIRMIRDSLTPEKGIYWIDFHPQSRQLTLKYDTSLISGQELYFFLVQKGLIRTTKDVSAQPDCCK